MHCQFCFRRFEGPTVELALKKVQEHEKECMVKKVKDDTPR